ncbi:YegP family protein [Photobacterium chitinilyticum]|uniref:DUF1508 domain-containing protein n=1 Tax=Photobacterium chitinilyticum TaxID=2485123 RepID=A0A444JIJ9_9GAMM|nr:YegP family protein [Photobacterium chitinilyticum]RWX52900.1 DUF1508 domain-containing protein [Photobacterium chitinilyticum]
MGRYELKQAKNQQFYFVLKAGNGEVILISEMYTTKAAALDGIASVQINAIERELFELNTASNGQFYFNLKAKNHQVIGTSEMYTTAASAKEGIHSVQFNGHSTQVDELTA